MILDVKVVLLVMFYVFRLTKIERWYFASI